MKRVKDGAAVALATALTLVAVLSACSRDNSSVASTRAPDVPAASADRMPEIVITAQRRPARDIVLSAHEAPPRSLD
ncbi:MAG TPA: hypothetical protein VHB68_15230 [Steroidobacteraceae bacterium]|nr:hypothetical protein [Steroidobacteraceae bacterium]